MTSNAKRKILCIDDEVSILTMRKIVLETLGYSVVTASDGEAGLKLLASQSVDLILLDYIMPNMNGGEVAQAVRRSGKNVPIIMVSALPDIPANAMSFIDAYVAKGESPSLLLELIDGMMKVRSHSHPEMTGKYVVFVDSKRRYVEATDAASELLGYSRAELIGMFIDDVSVVGSEKVTEMFEEYRRDGAMEGEFTLRHRNGSQKRVRFRAKAYPDGCMVASWEPIGATDRT
jgi:PAS domain S-box-containing protein